MPKMIKKNEFQNAGKAKTFKKSIKRLFSNLKIFRVVIIFALLLAMCSAVLSLVSPNKISKLTDEIGKGLVPNTKNIEILIKDITSSFEKENLQNTVGLIMNSEDISIEDKIELQNFLKINNEEEMIKIFKSLPMSIKSRIITPSQIDDVLITTEDKLNFLNIISTIDFNTNPQELYDVIDDMPETIRIVLEPKMNMNKIKNITLFLIILYIISSVFSYVQSILMTIVSNKYAKKLRNDISKKINKLPLKYFDNHETGDVLSRVTNDVDTVAQTMNQSLALLVSSCTLVIGSVIMMFYTNWILALTAIFSSLFGFIFVAIVLSKSQKYFVSKQTELGKLNGHIEEVYSGLNIVKVYNGQTDMDNKFDILNEKVRDNNFKSQFLSGLMMPFMGFIGNFGYVAVCTVGALLASNGTITFGIIIAFIVYIRLFSNPLSQIAESLSSVQSTVASSERVFEFLDEKEMEDESNKIKKLSFENAKGNIEFSKIKFGYVENKDIIKNFNFKVKKGEKIAIVGPTGAGKTTIVNLLMKFYNINSGKIIIDGYDINELTRENIHDLFIMVLQDTWLFNGTIRDNIIYNNDKKVSDKEIWKILEIVGVDHFVKTLPGNLNYEISDSDSISSGQKQLLTIARGMIKNSPFLVLDEATSSVDTRTEELVQKAMDILIEGRTSFIIAHRLSTIKNADHILVMNDGNIIEQGNHEELMKKNGFYAELYNSQFRN